MKHRSMARYRYSSVLSIFFFVLIVAVAGNAQTFTTLASFDLTNGADPVAPLVEGADGNFYGTTFGESGFTYGTVFRVTPTGVLTSLYTFCSLPNCADGAYPAAGLILASDGNFYGTTQTSATGGNVFKITPSGTLTTLYSFCATAGCPDGVEPKSPLLEASDGNFYGTTYLGGKSTQCGFNQGIPCGTIFRITPSGVLTTIYNFCSKPKCIDGGLPQGGLIQGPDGYLYGTTTIGGTPASVGIVFKVSLSGNNFKTLHYFNRYKNPTSGLILANDGNFYGTTSLGGNPTCGTGDGCLLGAGAVYQITPTGHFTAIYSFCSQSTPRCADGVYPNGPLVQGSDGYLYGTTQGFQVQGDQDATLFKLSLGGSLTTLYELPFVQGPSPNGIVPLAGVIQGTDGNFYGTTAYGGTSKNCGPIFACGTIFRWSN